MSELADLMSLFKKEFILCKVSKGETIGLVTERESKPDYVAAAEAAAKELGASVFEVRIAVSVSDDVPTIARGLGSTGRALGTDSIEAESLKRADMVVDLTSEGIVHAPIREEILAGGARMLTVIEPPEILERMFPREEIRTEVENAARLLESATEMKVESESGTDITFRVANSPVGAQYGYVDQPGRWDHWPSGFVHCYPVDKSAQGKIVLDRGDILLPFKRYVEEPVVLHFEEGFLRKIEGGFDALLIREYMESWKDPDAFATSHTGWGLDPQAQWSALALYDKFQVAAMDARSFRGNFMFSTGPNRFVGRYTQCHLDFPMRACSVFLDGIPVVEEGKIVQEVALSE